MLKTISRMGSTVFPATNNLLFNGAIQVAQRATSVASITTSGYNTADRYRVDISSLGTWTQSVENDAPTGSGFRKSLKMLCTTADATPAAGDYMFIEQRLEGQDLQSIRKGTTSAVPLRVSFRVKGSTTGTYIVRLLDNDNTRHVSVAYTINVADTWETKVISIPADTTGAFDNDNAYSLGVQFWLGAGTTYTSGTLASTWASVTNANAAVGQTNLAGATNRYWQITGVQLEVGSIASPFQFKSFAQELFECQRYYEKSYPPTTNPGTAGVAGPGVFFASSVANGYQYGTLFFKVTKRAQPTMTFYSYAGTVARASDGDASDLGATSAVTNGQNNTQSSTVGNGSGLTITPSGNNVFAHFVAEIEL